MSKEGRLKNKKQKLYTPVLLLGRLFVSNTKGPLGRVGKVRRPNPCSVESQWLGLTCTQPCGNEFSVKRPLTPNSNGLQPNSKSTKCVVPCLNPFCRFHLIPNLPPTPLEVHAVAASTWERHRCYMLVCVSRSSWQSYQIVAMPFVPSSVLAPSSMARSS